VLWVLDSHLFSGSSTCSSEDARGSLSIGARAQRPLCVEMLICFVVLFSLRHDTRARLRLCVLHIGTGRGGVKIDYDGMALRAGSVLTELSEIIDEYAECVDIFRSRFSASVLDRCIQFIQSLLPRAILCCRIKSCFMRRRHPSYQVHFMID
jgi:hypothetical protein